MSRLKSLLAIAVLGLHGSVASQSSQPLNQCFSHYESSMQDIVESRRIALALSDIRRSACSNANRSITGRFDSNTQAIINSVPAISEIGLGIDFSDNKSFCEHYSNRTGIFSDASLRTQVASPVSSSGLSDCLRILGNTNLVVTHDQSPSSVDFNVDFRNTRQPYLISVHSQAAPNTSHFQCTVPRRTGIDGLPTGESDQIGQFVLINDREITVNNQEDMPITCKRNGLVVGDGEVFGGAEVVLNINEETYRVTVPADTKYNAARQSIASSQIDDLASEVTSLRASLRSLQNSETTAKNFYVGSFASSGEFVGTHVGCSAVPVGGLRFGQSDENRTAGRGVPALLDGARDEAIAYRRNPSADIAPEKASRIDRYDTVRQRVCGSVGELINVEWVKHSPQGSCGFHQYRAQCVVQRSQ